MKTKYLYGMSATNFRSDGLTDVIFFATGPIIHKVPPKEANKYLVVPDVEFVDTDYFFPIFDSTEHARMITDLSMDKERNKLILEKYEDVGKDRQSVFISHRTDQLDYLQKQIDGSKVLTSKTKKSEREEIIQNLQNESLRCVLTTYGLFSTGIDIDSLEVLYMLTPMKSKRWIVQTAGRLKRKSNDNKTALVVDFVDKQVEMLKHQYYVRKRIWKDIQNEKI